MQAIRWGISGAGIAGRARSRAIRDDPSASLAAVYRGRFAKEIGAPVVESFEALLERVDAVAVCSPNPVHAEQARDALRARKHVVVEFPLASTRERGRKLFDLARAASRVLHVEHIELLSGTARTLRSHVQAQGLRHVEVRFTRGAEPVPGEQLALLNVARLHRACDLGGPIAEFESIEALSGSLHAVGRFVGGATLEIHISQRPELSRKTTIEVDHRGIIWRQDGDQLYRGKHPQTVLQGRGLFARDHAWAMRRIHGEVRGYVSEDRILHVLGAAERLASGIPGPVAI